MTSRYPFCLAALAAIALAACSKTEPQPPKVMPAPRVEAPAAPDASLPSSAEIDPALKERLARQEAAARMFERNVLEPAPPRSIEPARAPEPPPKPAEPAPSRPPAPAPRVDAPAPPPVAPPNLPLRTDVAAAKPAAVAPAPAPAPAPATRLVTRVDPEFPREAVKAGADKGSVKARITMDEAGGVRRVEILEAYPPRVFDRAVVSALTQWRFTEGAAGRTYDTEVEFRR
jgi:periplasmic protein TonB